MLLAALVAALTLVACGGGDDSETADRSATEILEETFAGGDPVQSGVLTVALDVQTEEGSGITGDAALKLTGPFETPEADDELPRFDFDLTISGEGAQALQAGAISTGDAGFLSFQGTDYAVPDDLFQEFRDGFVESQQGSDDGSAAPIDPQVPDWATDPQKAGTEEVGGVETEHITAGVDVAALFSKVREATDQVGSVAGQAGQVSKGDLEAIERQVKAAKVDVYTGAEDLRLRRLVVDVTLQSGTATFTLEIADLDEPQDIGEPSDPKPIDELVQQFQALTGGAASGAAPGPAAGATGGAAAGGADQRYLDCVEAAGQDIEALQACSKYL